jgi:hypothetical protein
MLSKNAVRIISRLVAVSVAEISVMRTTAVFEMAVAGLVRRVDGTPAESEGRFPVYADPESGVWTWTDDGGWTGRFWAALIWGDYFALEAMLAVDGVVDPGEL